MYIKYKITLGSHRALSEVFFSTAWAAHRSLSWFPVVEYEMLFSLIYARYVAV